MAAGKRAPVVGRRKKNSGIRWILAIDALSVIVLFSLIAAFLWVDNREKFSDLFRPEEVSSANAETVSEEAAASSAGEEAGAVAGGEYSDPDAVPEGEYSDPDAAPVGGASVGVNQFGEEVDFDYAGARDWIHQNRDLFAENQVSMADDNDHYCQMLYRWMHDDYTLLETKDIHLTDEELNASIPLFEQFDARWAYTKYGEEIIGTSGCGPTAMSMVACGLLKDTSINPQSVAEYAMDHKLYLWGTGTKWKIFPNYSRAVGLRCTDLKNDQGAMISELEKGHPVIVSVRKGIFTYGGHFLVLTGIDEDGNISMNDPMSPEHSARTWQLSEFSDQIKNGWSFSTK